MVCLCASVGVCHTSLSISAYVESAALRQRGHRVDLCCRDDGQLSAGTMHKAVACMGLAFVCTTHTLYRSSLDRQLCLSLSLSLSLDLKKVISTNISLFLPFTNSK